MLDLDALLKKADEAFSTAEPGTLDVVLAGETVTVRFMPLPSTEWRDLVAVLPPRQGSTVDATAGYNVDAAVRVFPKAAIVSGDEVDDLHRDGVYIWADVYARFAAPDQKDLATLLWGMHEWKPVQRAVAAGKASSARGRKRSSRANSASPSEN